MSCAERIDVGADVYIGAGSWLSVVDEHLGCRYDPHLVIGNGVSLGPGIVISCTGRVEIGDRVLATSRVFIGDSYHDYRDPDAAVTDQPMSDPDPVCIGSGAFLGIGAIILPGVTVGQHAYVGAGAVVTSDVPPRAVVAGNPARIIRRRYADRQAWIGVTAPGEPERLRDPTTDAPTPTVDRNTTDVDKRVAALVHRAALADAKLATCDEEVRALEAERDRFLARAVEVERRAAEPSGAPQTPGSGSSSTVGRCLAADRAAQGGQARVGQPHLSEQSAIGAGKPLRGGVDREQRDSLRVMRDACRGRTA